MKVPAGGAAAGAANPAEGERKTINAELWHACAGPLVSLPPVGSLVVYFPQGHSEQVAASMPKNVDAHIPNYPNLPSKLICLLHNVTLHADPETDEVYAQMTLQPINTIDEKALLASDIGMKPIKPQTDFFCKTLTASDTSTHGGFSVPRRAAEKIFPPLDFSMQPPAQELQARDLHDSIWTFRHIYRGQPKRHLLTTGWSLFVSGKRLFAGDSVLFIRDEKQHLLLGIRRANRQPTNISSSVLSSDSMHIGILAAAAHAAANHSPFTVFYNPRASPSEFVIPLAKYQKSVYGNQISLGMRFRMMFETEDSGTRRYMGTITGISDLDPARWKNSQWRNLQVGWDESAAGERRNRVSIWDIEPVAAPFFICPPPFFRSKRPRQPGMLDDEASEMENLFKRAMPWLGEEICIKDAQSQSTIMPGLSLVQWMNMQHNPSLNPNMQPDYMRSMTGPVIQNLGASDHSRQFGLQAQLMQQNNIQFNAPRLPQQTQQIDQSPKTSVATNQISSVSRPQQQMQDIALQQRQQLVNQTVHLNQNQSNLMQSQFPVQNQLQQQQPIMQNQQQQPIMQSQQEVSTNLHSHQANQYQQLLLQQQQHQQQMLQQQQIQLQQQMQHQQQQHQQQQQQQHQQQQHQQHQQQQHQQHQQQQHQQFQQQQFQENRMHAQLTKQTNQQLQLPENPIQLQLLRKLQQQQQQAFFTQATQQLTQLPQVQETRAAIIETPHNITNTTPLPQQCAKATSSNMWLPQSTQQQSLLSDLPEPNNLLSITGRALLAAGGTQSALLAAGGTQSGLTDDVPSCSTSPSTDNCSVLPQMIQDKTHHYGTIMADKASHSTVTMLSPNSFQALAARPNETKEFPKSEQNLNHSVPIPKVQNQGIIAPQPQTYISNMTQLDYLDTSSSATSVCLSQADGSLQQRMHFPSFNQPSTLGDAIPDSIDERNNSLFRVNIEDSLGIPLTTNPLLTDTIDSGKYQNIDSGKYQNSISENVITEYRTTKDVQELSSSIVSQSFGVPELAFNSIDSAIEDASLWAPAPPFQRMRTYTKVYKRGAVGRSIDMSRYSDYDELKHDLARMFSIEGQLEDRQRVGWKLVYVDHENDVLLVGDDPWEEFVNCVRCIRILSPQEVQQMRMDGDLGGNIQACSSSDGGNAWRAQAEQISGNHSAGSYEHLE